MCVRVRVCVCLPLQVLHTANRTTSGGDAYEVLVRVLGNPALVLVSADSKRAPPVVVDAGVGTYCGRFGAGTGRR
jgi:hypothetical protein